jgi:hypothetical protein
MGAIKVSEINIKASGHSFMITFDIGDVFFSRNAFFFGFKHYGSAVSIIRTEIQAVVAAQGLESYPNIGLDLLEHMAEM